MTGNHRSTSPLQRHDELQTPSRAALTLPREPEGTISTVPSAEDRPTAHRVSGDGWATPEDRRMSMQALAFFGVLGLYAVAFVLLGTLVWS